MVEKMDDLLLSSALEIQGCEAALKHMQNPKGITAVASIYTGVSKIRIAE